MSARQDYWISISDLMAGVVAVMVLLFVMSTIHGALGAARQAEDRRQEAARDRGAGARAPEDTTATTAARDVEGARRRAEEAEIAALFTALQQEIDSAHLADAVELVPSERRIRFQDATFGLGSACVSKPAQRLLAAWSSRHVRPFMQNNSRVRIAIEGHSDRRDFMVNAGFFSWRPGHRENDRCALFDDNFTLSAARAREAREAVTQSTDPWPASLADRVTVAGYGSSRPRQGRDVNDPRQRRVEFLILTEGGETVDPQAHAP